MKVKVTKPVGGRTTVTVNDRRGSTGLFRAHKDLPVASLRGVLEKDLGDWEEARSEVLAIRKKSLGR